MGAIVSTIGIFLPSFLFVALLNQLIKKMRNSIPFSVFLDAVNVTAVALISAICFQIGLHVIWDWRTILIVLISFLAALIYKKIFNAVIVLCGLLMGYLLTFIG